MHTLDPNTVKDIHLLDAIGYQCVAPSFYADIKTHHRALHTELNKKP